MAVLASPVGSVVSFRKEAPHMVRRITIALAVLLLPALAGSASAQPLPAPTTTVRATSGPQKCSVTAFGPEFGKGAVQPGFRLLKFAAGVSCAPPPERGVGVFKKLELQLQIQGPDHKTWFVRDSQLYFTRGWGSPVRIANFAQYEVDPGHEFRAVAIATLFEPNGHAGCSLQGLFGCYQQVSVTADSPPETS
jgi:hypothetical protein